VKLKITTFKGENMAIDDRDRNEIRLIILNEIDSLLRESSFSVFRDRELNSAADEIHKKLFENVVKRLKDVYARKEME
jgi:hypothetical protein